MKKEGKGIYKATFFMCLLIFPIAMIAKIYEYNFMDDDAFIIIGYILNGIKSNTLTGDLSFDFPIKIFSFLRFFSLDYVSLGIISALLMNIICFIILISNKKTYKRTEYIFIFLTVFILNFTVFDINKDIIQFIIMLIIYRILTCEKISDTKKVIITAAIFLYESLVFRRYYILTSGLFVMIYFLLKDIEEKKKRKSIVGKCILIILFFFGTIFIMQYISYDSYIQLIDRRTRLEQIEANTIIRNLIPGNGYGTFCANYLINLFRCLFPVEIASKGAKYIIFTIYQIFISCSLLKSLKRINKNSIVWISVILAYCLTMAASESDFGTFVRHQSVLMFIYLYIIKLNRKQENINE